MGSDARTRVGRYEVVGPLQEGGMGTVLEARAPDGSRVAIKVLKGKKGERDRERFDRERRLQGDLGEADGFVPLLDSGVEGDDPFLVMPLLEGGTLRKRLDAGPLPVDETRALGRRLARALGRAHARGIVHRDLKPDNVLFTKDGTPLIADLGLAKRFIATADDPTENPDISRTGVMQGTIRYMAPEQAENAKLAGPPADVFSLGAILYECLGGRPAFPGDSVVEVLRSVLRGVPAEPLQKLRPELPSDLTAVVARALDRDPAHRFPDGEALARALEGNAPQPASRLPIVVVLALVAVAVVVAIASSGSQPPPVAAPPVAPVESKVVPVALPEPPRAELALRAAEAALDSHDWTGATDGVALVLSISNDAAQRARAFAVRAEVRSQAHDVDGTIADASQAIEQDEFLARPWLLRGTARSASKKDRKAAIADLERFLDLAPDSPDADRARSTLTRLKKKEREHEKEKESEREHERESEHKKDRDKDKEHKSRERDDD